MLNFSRDISPIGGWLTKSEGEYLYSTAKDLSSKSIILEIGSWKGRSTICLAKGSQDGSKPIIYAIDPHTGSSEHKKWFGEVNTYKEFINNLKKSNVFSLVKPIKKTSEIFAKEFNAKIDFVLVDGAHEYSMVKKDYELWFPRLKNNRYIAFHDCWHAPGVHLLTAYVLITSSKIIKPRIVDTLSIFEKVNKNTTLNRIENIAFITYRLLFGWIGTVKINYFGGTILK